MIVISVPRHMYLSANGRHHWADRSRRAKMLRNMGFWCARSQARDLHLDRAVLDINIEWPNRQRHDRANASPTIKHCIDGMVDAGIIPDDDDGHLDGPHLHTDDGLCHRNYACVLRFEFQPVVS